MLEVGSSSRGGKWLGAAVLCTVVVAANAKAHAPPFATELLSDEAGEVTAVVTNRGLIFKDLQTGNFQLMCNDALGIDSSSPPWTTIVSDGRVLTATYRGLQATADRGCTWQEVEPFGTINVPLLTPHPADRDTFYIATYATGQAGVHVSRDGGATFEQLLELSDTQFPDSLAVAPSDPNTIYLTGTDFSSGFSFFLLRTHDGGATWDQVTLPQEEADYRAVVQAVSPQDPQALLLSTETLSPQVDPSRLLRSSDGGDSFVAAFETLEIGDAGYAPDGQEWVAALDGLFEFNSDTGVFDKVASDAGRMTLAKSYGDTLLAAGYYDGDACPSGIGQLVVGGNGEAAFRSFLDFREVETPITCPISAPINQLCQRLWSDWELEMLSGPPPDPACGIVDGQPAQVDGGGTTAVEDGGVSVAGSLGTGAGGEPALGGAAAGVTDGSGGNGGGAAPPTETGGTGDEEAPSLPVSGCDCSVLNGVGIADIAAGPGAAMGFLLTGGWLFRRRRGTRRSPRHKR